MIITFVLVIGTFVIGFMKNTNSSPNKVENIATINMLNLDYSSTFKEYNLIMMTFNHKN